MGTRAPLKHWGSTHDARRDADDGCAHMVRFTSNLSVSVSNGSENYLKVDSEIHTVGAG